MVGFGWLTGRPARLISWAGGDGWIGLEGGKQQASSKQASKHTSAWLVGSGIITFFLLSFSFLFFSRGWVGLGLVGWAYEASK